MGETNGSHRGIFSMRSTVATPPSLLPQGRTKTARYIAGFLAALMAVVAMALGSAACTELAEAQTDPSTDRVALVALYNATDGPNWSNETNWLSAEPIGEWHGVTTDGSGRVTALDLDENELNGKMPAELGSLSNLQRLYLNDNSGLSGPLPGSSTGLTSLTYLDLSGTGVCAPTDASFQAWLENIATRLGVVNCREQTTGDPLIDRYDTNNNATIERSEVLAAIDDHLFGGADETISRAEVLRLIDLHLFGPPTATPTPEPTPTPTATPTPIPTPTAISKPVTIPDPNLRREIERSLGKSSGTPVFSNEMETLLSFEVRYEQIGDLEGIQFATNLRRLELVEIRGSLVQGGTGTFTTRPLATSSPDQSDKAESEPKQNLGPFAAGGSDKLGIPEP